MIEAKLQGVTKVLAVVRLGGGRGREGEWDFVMKGGVGACLTLYK